MTVKKSILLSVAVLTGLSHPAKAGIDLGTTANFSVLAGSTVTNTGPSFINGGDVGVNSTSSITGFLPGMLAAPYTFRTDDVATAKAQLDLATAYAAIGAMTPTQNLTGQDLGGLTLTPGVYFFSSSAQLTGTLTLNDLGDPNAQFAFQIGSTLTTSVNASVVTINGGSSNIFWQVGNSATLQTGSAFEGNILAQASITLTTGATIMDGRALAMQGAVTLDDNLIIASANAVPEPGSIVLATIGGAVLGFSVLAKKLHKGW